MRKQGFITGKMAMYFSWISRVFAHVCLMYFSRIYSELLYQTRTWCCVLRPYFLLRQTQLSINGSPVKGQWSRFHHHHHHYRYHHHLKNMYFSCISHVFWNEKIPKRFSKKFYMRNTLISHNEKSLLFENTWEINWFLFQTS